MLMLRGVRYATFLLVFERPSNWYITLLTRYLGHLYLAEAQVSLDRIADAVRHLDPESVTDISTVFPEQKSTDQGKAQYFSLTLEALN